MNDVYEDDDYWEVPPNIDTDHFDFTWTVPPALHGIPYIHQFGTQHQKTGGPRYVEYGATDIKYQDIIKAIALPDMTNWVIPQNIDTSRFDFSWHPEAVGIPYIHQFGTQHQKTGGPRYVEPGATEIKYCESIITATALPDMSNWAVPQNIDTTGFDFSWHPEVGDSPYIHQFGTQHQKTGGPRYTEPGAIEIKYYDSMTVTAIVDMTHWVVPPNIDTSGFDFSWHPEETDQPYIHEFGTQHQKTGGPRYTEPGAIDIKYHSAMITPALINMSNWVITNDIEINDFDFSWHPDATVPLCNYSIGDSKLGMIKYQVPSATEWYHIQMNTNIRFKPLDIIFMSNGESGEQSRYGRLKELVGDRVKWVKGISGRENAIRHAATISSTEWFILFPGKLYADARFDFDFQPDRAYEPKHYIFYAKNPLNDLEYGHQSAVCYHRDLVLDTIDYGLDFTMSKLHDIVPIISGVAQYNSSIIMTWRTAFREAIKLKAAGDEESLGRLEVWKSYARGQYCEWSIIGALDGLAYFDQVNGDHDQLMNTFKWSWLDEYFTSRYSAPTNN